MVIEDFRGDLEQRMEKLNSLLKDQKSLILVGSSYGGLMASIYGLNNPDSVRRLILLSPALAHDEVDPYLERSIDTPVIIYHGQRDDVVPMGPVQEKARRLFVNLTFNAVDDDHVLSRTFASIDWDTLLTMPDLK